MKPLEALWHNTQLMKREAEDYLEDEPCEFVSGRLDAIKEVLRVIETINAIADYPHCFTLPKDKEADDAAA